MTKRTNLAFKIIKRHRVKIIILSIIVVVGISLWAWYLQARADSDRRNTDILFIGQLMEKYHNQYSKYPCSQVTVNCDWEEELQKVNKGNPIPKDPITNKSYHYLTDGEKSIVGAVKSAQTVLCGKADRVLWMLYNTSYKKEKLTSSCTPSEKLYHSMLNLVELKKPSIYLNYPSFKAYWIIFFGY